jgi:hypothetical protein
MPPRNVALLAGILPHNHAGLRRSHAAKPLKPPGGRPRGREQELNGAVEFREQYSLPGRNVYGNVRR